MDSVWQDVRYAVRMLSKTPMVTFLILLSLAIGIGANSAIFSVVDALLLRPLPYPQPDQLAAVWIHSPGIGIFRDWPSPGQFKDLQIDNHSFQGMSLSRLTSFTLTGRDQPVLIDGMRTTSSLFSLLGAHAKMGRLLVPDDEMPGAPPVAVISYALWQRLFSSDPQLVGKSITLNGNPFNVAGVLSPDFTLNSEVMPAEGPADKMDIFLPLQGDAAFWNRRGDENYNIIVRLKPAVSIQQAQTDVDLIASRIREKDKRHETFGMTVTGLLDQVVGDVRRTLLVLLGSVSLVLLIACANVANLLLTRAAGREREVAVRVAIGAGWQRLMRQLLTESVLLALLGGAAGIAIAEASMYAVRVMNPGNIPRLGDIRMNAAVVAFTFAVSLLTGILFGLAPVWNAVTVDVNSALKSGGRSGHDGGGLRLARHRLRSLLAVSELALSLMLLIGAGLLIRSFFRIAAVPPGFSTDHIISMRVMVGGGPKYRKPEVLTQFYRDAGTRILNLPGVQSYGLVSALPLTGTVGWGGINVEGFPAQPGHELQVDLRQTDAGYFGTMRIPLIKGRFFSEHDTPESERVVIIDQHFAEQFWPHDNPIGKHLWFDPKQPFVISGVVGNVKQYGLEADAKIVAYFANSQQPGGGMFLVARTSPDPASLANPIVAQIHAVDPDVVVHEIRTMPDRLYASLARQRFAMSLLGSFSVFAMMLAAIGVYGVISYLVSQNTNEIGIRIALGAQTAGVLGMVVRQGLTLAGIGIFAGIIGAMALTRVMASLLFGVSALDFGTFVSVPSILALVALAATVIPATRVLRVAPSVALRQD